MSVSEPDRTRSRSRFRSNSAKDKITARISFPEKVEALPPTDKPEVRQTKWTPADRQPDLARSGLMWVKMWGMI